MEDLWLRADELLDEPHILSLAIFLGSILVAWLAEVVISRSLALLARRSNTELDDQIISVLRRPIFVSVILYGISWAIEPLNLVSRATWAIHGFLETAAVLVWASAAFQLSTLILQAFSRRASLESVLQQRTLPLFNMAIHGAVVGMAIYFLFLAWHIDVTAWLASAGVIGIVIGFAAQDSLANLFAGIFIIVDAPYKVGDFIVLDNGVRGRVTRIGFRSTRVLTPSDVEVTVPNSIIGASTISNEAGGPSVKQRIAVAVDAAYGSDVDQVRAVLVACVTGIAGISESPHPMTRFRAFGPSGLAFELMVWIDDPQERDRILDVMHERVYKGFRAAQIEIPFSKHDLYIKEAPNSQKDAPVSLVAKP